jgi:hypothetical protein
VIDQTFSVVVVLLVEDTSEGERVAVECVKVEGL